MDVYCRLTRRARGCIDDSVAGLARYGPLSVILGRFFTVVRVVTWPMLVRNGLGRPRFAAPDAVGPVVWPAIWVGPGRIVGAQWQDAAQSASGALPIAGAGSAVGQAGPPAARPRP